MVFCSSPWFPLAFPCPHLSWLYTRKYRDSALCILFVWSGHDLRALMDFFFFLATQRVVSVVSFLCMDAIKNGWDKEKILPGSNRTSTL